MDVSVGLEVAPGVGCSVGDGVGGFEHAPVCMHTIALPSPEQLRSELQPTHTCGLAIVLHLGLVGCPVPMQSLFDRHTWAPDVGDDVLLPPSKPLVGLFVSR